MNRPIALVSALCLLLTACGGNTVSPPSSASTDPFSTAAVPDALAGVAAHYVVEYGTLNGTLAGDLRQVQETSAFVAPSAGAGAVITYPDGSTQTAAADGSFDAGASAYAAAKPQALTDPDVTVTVAIPGNPVPAFTAYIWVPSSAEEAAAWSGVESGPASSTLAAPSVAAQAAPTCPTVGSTSASGTSSIVVSDISMPASKSRPIAWVQTFTNKTDFANGAKASLAACGISATPLGTVSTTRVVGCPTSNSACNSTQTSNGNFVRGTLRFEARYTPGALSVPAWKYDVLSSVPPAAGAGWSSLKAVLITVCRQGATC